MVDAGRVSDKPLAVSAIRILQLPEATANSYHCILDVRAVSHAAFHQGHVHVFGALREWKSQVDGLGDIV